jgi:hypothetical protein
VCVVSLDAVWCEFYKTKGERWVSIMTTGACALTSIAFIDKI